MSSITDELVNVTGNLFHGGGLEMPEAENFGFKIFRQFNPGVNHR